MNTKWQSGLEGGMVIANPIPEQFAMPESKINAAIEQAVAESVEQGIQGKDSTPFLLARVAELTGGDSLTQIFSWYSIMQNWPLRLHVVTKKRQLKIALFLKFYPDKNS